MSFVKMSGTFFGKSLLEIIKFVLILNFINFAPLNSSTVLT